MRRFVMIILCASTIAFAALLSLSVGSAASEGPVKPDRTVADERDTPEHSPVLLAQKAEKPAPRKKRDRKPKKQKSPDAKNKPTGKPDPPPFTRPTESPKLQDRSTPV